MGKLRAKKLFWSVFLHSPEAEMIVAFLQKLTVALITSAASRSLCAFRLKSRQIDLGLLLRKKHIVLRAAVADCSAAKWPPFEGVGFTQIPTWTTLKLVVDCEPKSVAATVDLGRPDWFDKGWRRRIGAAKERLACLRWRRTTEQFQGFFCWILRGPNVRGM
jgi:hypothetical protein